MKRHSTRRQSRCDSAHGHPLLLCRYDKLMRTDEDAFLTPRLLTWRPPHEAMFGTGGHSHPFNEQRLPQIAKKYGLRHQGGCFLLRIRS